MIILHNKSEETNQKSADGFLIAHFKRCSFPQAGTSNVRAEHLTCHLPFAGLRYATTNNRQESHAKPASRNQQADL